MIVVDFRNEERVSSIRIAKVSGIPFLAIPA
jgi:hypothetical protein